MYTDALVAGRGTIANVTYPCIELYDSQIDIVSRLIEKHDGDGKAIDFVHISAYSPMEMQLMHTRDVSVLPPKDVTEMNEYVQQHFNHRSFVLPLLYCGVLSSIYYFNPRGEQIAAYKENKGLNVWTRTLDAHYQRFNGGHCMVYKNYFNDVIWSPKPRDRTIKEMVSKINKNTIPFVVSINLDALQYICGTIKERVQEMRMKSLAGVMTNPLRNMQALWQGEQKYVHYSSQPLLEQLTTDDFDFSDESCTQEEIRVRGEKICHFLQNVRKPDLVMISRSQKPIPSCPPKQWKELESSVLECLLESGHFK